MGRHLAAPVKEEFGIVLAFPDEELGRAYVRTEFHEIGGRRFPKTIVREDLGSQSAPTWPRGVAENLADSLRALFPQTTIELKRAE